MSFAIKINKISAQNSSSTQPPLVIHINLHNDVRTDVHMSLRPPRQSTSRERERRWHWTKVFQEFWKSLKKIKVLSRRNMRSNLKKWNCRAFISLEIALRAVARLEFPKTNKQTQTELYKKFVTKITATWQRHGTCAIVSQRLPTACGYADTTH